MFTSNLLPFATECMLITLRCSNNCLFINVLRPTITHRRVSTTLAVWVVEGKGFMDSVFQHLTLGRHLVDRSASSTSFVSKCLELKMTSSWTSRTSSYVQSGAHSSPGARYLHFYFKMLQMRERNTSSIHKNMIIASLLLLS